VNGRLISALRLLRGPFELAEDPGEQHDHGAGKPAMTTELQRRRQTCAYFYQEHAVAGLDARAK